MARRIKKEFNKNIYAILGGFHMEFHPSFIIKLLIGALKKLGVEKVGPSHCSGDLATSLFKKAYKDNFIEFNLGDSIVF